VSYRAHLQVYNPETQKRISPDAILRTVHLQAPVHKGTRTGAPGFWIETRDVATFRYYVLTTLRLLANDVGYQVEVAATNHPSYEAVRGLAGSLPARTAVRRG
jgi:hypothetical protein